MEIIEFIEDNPLVNTLRISLTHEELSEHYSSVLSELRDRTDVPGFRKGKASSGIVERQIGKIEIWRLTCIRASETAFENALQCLERTSISYPDFQLETYSGNGDYEFRVTFCPPPPSPDSIIKKAHGDEKAILPEDHYPDGKVAGVPSAPDHSVYQNMDHNHIVSGNQGTSELVFDPKLNLSKAINTDHSSTLKQKQFSTENLNSQSKEHDCSVILSNQPIPKPIKIVNTAKQKSPNNLNEENL